MEIQEYINELKQIQHNILQYLDDPGEATQIFNDVCDSISKTGYKKNYHLFKHILLLIVKLSNHHLRSPLFYTKIDEILKYLKDQVKQSFTNYEIFNIFKRNKRLLLFFVQTGIFQFDETLYNIIKSDKYSSRCYPDYFYPEIKDFILKEPKVEEEEEETKEIGEDFYENRNKGENNSPLIQIIQKDSLEEFKSILEKDNLTIDTIISERSTFETNPHLLKNSASLVEYAAFYGAGKVFNFLIKQGVKMENFSTYCAVHGNNKDILKAIERRAFKDNSSKHSELLDYSIRCHLNDLTAFIMKFWVKAKVAPSQCCFRAFNFELFPNDLLNQENYVMAVKYDYIDIVKHFLNENEIDINPVINPEIFLKNLYLMKF